MNSAYQSVSLERVNTLSPKLVASATKVLNEAWKDRIPVYVVWGSRTIEQQDMLYRFGRSIPGDIITNKRGGFSPHNYGLALDFCLVHNDKFLDWNDVHERDYWRAKWFRLTRLFEAEEWTSGWRWSDFQPGHVENLLGNTIGDLHKIYEQENQARYNRI